MGDLPSPVSVTDEYLAAIHGVLGEIRGRLPAPKDDPKPGRAKVSEPGKAPAKRAARKTS